MSRSEREVKDLESLCEFFSEGALRAPAFAGALGRSLLYGSVRRRAALDRPCAMSRRRALGALGSLRAWRRPMSGRSTRWRWALALGSGWLRGVSPEQAILQRSTIKASDDGVHLLRVGRFDERESLGFLRFRIADNFNCVRDQVLGCQPSLDVVRSDPGGQVAQKDGKTHPWLSYLRERGFCLMEGVHVGINMLPHSILLASTPVI